MGMRINAFGEHYDDSPSYSKGAPRRWYQPAYDPYGRAWKHVFILTGLALLVAGSLWYAMSHGAFDRQYDWLVNQNTSCVTDQQPMNTDPGKQC